MRIVKNKDFQRDDSRKRHHKHDSPLRFPMHAEWAQTHENTLLDAATVTINKSVLKGKDGHVYYFGSNQLGSIGSKN